MKSLWCVQPTSQATHVTDLLGLSRKVASRSGTVTLPRLWQPITLALPQQRLTGISLQSLSLQAAACTAPKDYLICLQVSKRLDKGRASSPLGLRARQQKTVWYLTARTLARRR